MDRHSIVLRAANPTFDEGLASARYLDEAAEGFFRFMLGRRAGYIIATAFAQPDHDLSYLGHLAAEGKLRPVIDRVFPLPEAKAAHNHSEQGHTRGKIVLQVIPS